MTESTIYLGLMVPVEVAGNTVKFWVPVAETNVPSAEAVHLQSSAWVPRTRESTVFEQVPPEALHNGCPSRFTVSLTLAVPEVALTSKVTG
jgi:hypothetical protein